MGPVFGHGAYDLAPYCGAPPTPLTLLHRWNFEPVLIAALLTVFAAYAINARSARAVGMGRQSCFYGGWVIGGLALISPLCPLSVSLFSARVGQHMLLATVVAPLIALGLPAPTLVRKIGAQAWIPALAFAAVLWFWHAPGPYAATFQHAGIYWLMHLTAFGAAYWLWTALLSGSAARLVDRLAAIAITTLQMSVLGAVITFAPRPTYAVHALTTTAWGLTPLEDQQLGGVIMWIPAGVIFVAALILSLAQLMRRDQPAAVGMAL